MRLGTKQSVEAKAKISKARSGKHLGKHPSEETRRKMSKAQMGNKHNLGKHLSDETKLKISIKNRERIMPTGKLAYAFGHKLSEEAKSRISKANTGRKLSDKVRAKMSETTKKLWENPEHRAKIDIVGIGRANLGIKRSDETKRKISLGHKGQIAWNKGQHLSIEHRRKLSDKRKILWSTLEYRERTTQMLWDTLSKRIKAWHTKPNIPETKLSSLLNKLCPKEWEYTGDGKIVITGLCPDFTNINGQKKVIELFGDYFHKGENPQIKINRYAKFGFGCLIIWEHELADIPVLENKILEFNARIA